MLKLVTLLKYMPLDSSFMFFDIHGRD